MKCRQRAESGLSSLSRSLPTLNLLLYIAVRTQAEYITIRFHCSTVPGHLPESQVLQEPSGGQSVSGTPSTHRGCRGGAGPRIGPRPREKLHQDGLHVQSRASQGCLLKHQ